MHNTKESAIMMPPLFILILMSIMEATIKNIRKEYIMSFFLKKTGFQEYLPLILIETFFSLAYLLYRFGPWMYPYRKDNVTLIFFMGCCFLFCLGYCIATKKYNRKCIDIDLTDPDKLIHVLVGIGLITFIPYCYVNTGSFYPKIWSSFNDLGLAYQTALNRLPLGTIFKINSLIVDIIKFPLVIILYICWNKINNPLKYAGFFLSLWFYATDLCIGRNRSVMFVSICFLIMYSAKVVRGAVKNIKEVSLRTTIITLAIILVGPLYFAATMNSRGSAAVEYANFLAQSGKNSSEDKFIKDIVKKKWGYVRPKVVRYKKNINEVDKLEFNIAIKPGKVSSEVVRHKKNIIKLDKFNEFDMVIKPGEVSSEIVERYEKYAPQSKKVHPFYANDLTYAFVNVGDPFFAKLPSRVQYLYAQVSNYLSHGFQGLTIGLRTNFNWTFGFGQALVLQNKFEKMTGIDIYSRSYISKVNAAGYPISYQWCTAFLQFASDFTFIGAVLFMGFLGFLFASLWIETIYKEDILATVLLVYLSFSLLLLTSWWQPSLSPADFLVFYGGIFTWLIKKSFWYNRELTLGISIQNGLKL